MKHTIWKAAYNVSIVPLLLGGMQVMRVLSAKVRKGQRGRREVLPRVQAFMESHAAVMRVWVHASSMGEFEQAKPIIEMMKADHPDVQVIASFFSPSGYDNNLRYQHADHITYIPLDTAHAARRFVELLRPAVAIIIRYDVWPNHIWACERAGIPVILVNATLRERSLRLLPVVRSFHRAIYNAMQAVLTVSDLDAAQFRRMRLSTPDIRTTGDTRYDRVVGRAETARSRQLVPPSVRRNRPVIVFGSSWSEDEEVFLPVVFKLIEQGLDALFIIVPHEPTIAHLETLEYRLRGHARSLRFSHIAQHQDEQVLLVDSVGNLLSLYASADVAFVGGGFKSNVHNTLEPAAYGIPVLFGPRIDNSQEARELIEAGGAVMVRNRQECFRQLRRLLDDDGMRTAMGQAAGTFVHSRAGSTRVILDLLRPMLE